MEKHPEPQQEKHTESVPLRLAKGVGKAESGRRSVLALVIGLQIVLIPILIVLWIRLSQAVRTTNDERISHGRLWAAAKSGDADAVGELLDQGVDVNARPPGGYSALTWAVLSDQTKVAETLLQKGADIHARHADGTTLLDHAKSDEMRALLLKYGAGPPEAQKASAE